jgi:hypothetical protein
VEDVSKYADHISNKHIKNIQSERAQKRVAAQNDEYRNALFLPVPLLSFSHPLSFVVKTAYEIH